MAGPRSEGRLYERIAESLRQSLRQGRFSVGDRLPSERDLAQQFGVSRPTVREAIISLEVDGLVEVRTNSGVYVAALDVASGDRAPLDVGPFELLEARRVFEAEVCAVAALHIDDERIARLRELAVAMESEDIIDAETADQEFHLEIARATQNSAMEMTIANLWDARDKSPQYNLLTNKVRAAGVAPRVPEHRAIIDALERRDPAAARDAMRSHLERVFEELLEATETEAIERARAEVAEKRKRFSHLT
ncbi:MAG: GntR family transcriptional regulator [Sphingomonas sp.]|nr:GntR family transcriptional regulator [Sphingomonas sp.]